MKMFNTVSVSALALSFALGFAGPLTALAATSPSLGAAATYGVLSSTYTNTTVTTINGDVGFTTGPAVAPLGVHTNYGSGAPYATAGTDQASALSNLNGQACTFTFAPGAIDLALDTTHGPIGVYVPGVYCTSGAASIGTAGLTISGSGTYIFRIDGALTSVANSAVTLAGGASACDVFWTPTAATTLGANSTFVGTNVDTSGITIGSTVTWTGSALAFGGTVTT
ncbi:MAG: ice-binding family protein, partial [bacterium]|nr:ice-binding family protein [bacterium]